MSYEYDSDKGKLIKKDEPKEIQISEKKMYQIIIAMCLGVIVYLYAKGPEIVIQKEEHVPGIIQDVQSAKCPPKYSYDPDTNTCRQILSPNSKPIELS